MWDVLLLDCQAGPSPRIRDAAIGIARGRLAFVGPTDSLPGRPRDLAREIRPLGGAFVTPGLIDCHTHLVFAGNRAGEWDMRARGASYEEIARAGGGILATVRATRKASEDELVDAAVPRAAKLAHEGVTTVEIKSGYGLDLECELKMLRAAARVGEKAHVRVRRTFLGAHAVPPDCERGEYLRLLCEEMIPAAARGHLADAVDAFCETIAFAPDEVERVFAAAQAHGLALRLHAEQLTDCGGAALAARHGALCADHLEHLGEAGIAAMAGAGTVAVLLPTAFYFLRETKKPPVEALRAAGVAMAVATDCNPGTSPVVSLLTAMNMACTLFGLTPEEALVGVTRNAARALGLDAETGALETGKWADLAVWNIIDPAELSYWIGAGLLQDRYLEGRSDRYDR
ncbi:MAG TPA: imidazolonepropionase [Rhizomicrobium sp.]|nr:imidazolonepropionase [Rhizomicrobium sp.]